jgi:hypothetical protein
LIRKHWNKNKFGLKPAKQVPIGLSSDDIAAGYTGLVEAILLVLLLLLHFYPCLSCPPLVFTEPRPNLRALDTAITSGKFWAINLMVT